MGALSNLVEKSPKTFGGWIKDGDEKGGSGREIERLVKREGGGRIAGRVWESIKYVSITVLLTRAA